MNSLANTQIFNILSLFTGGGFLDIGFINNGFQIQEAVEVNTEFIHAHNQAMDGYFKRSNNQYIKKKLVTFCKIESPIDASDFDSVRAIVKKNKNITGIIGGPPCQDFSTGGKNAGASGNRGKLLFSYCEFVSQAKPLFIFFENVGGLITTKVHKNEGFDKLTENLKAAGYFLWYDILNSLEYGIPQDRPRVVLVGFRKDLVETLIKNGFSTKTGYVSTAPMVFNWPQKKYPGIKNEEWPHKWPFQSKITTANIEKLLNKYPEVTVSHAFKNLTDKSPNQAEYFNPYSERFNLIEEGDTNRKSFKRLHRYRYSPTVAYGNNEVHLHPTEPRRLTVREALRLQSVPDTYILPPDMTLTAKYKLISNGVPVKKAELVAKEIRRTLINYFNLK